MALGPFVRIMAQIAMVAGGAIGRAAMEAYKEAAAGRGAAAAAAQKIARRRMSLDEARKVLDAEGAAVTEALIEERFNTLNGLNAPSEESPGSPYLQDRISAARQVLIDSLKKEGEQTAEKAGKAKPPPEE
eukprot:TRINITY_DN54359_c0_g1_i1.p1 TRINITY_DN54359_c0_g1~~TRINITY_DN54359_c0_g1_i1.p1  ORF type:complete len:141 (-),score=45.30 TRINITY_DN54359_c0_g1_i1:57-449(-)